MEIRKKTWPKYFQDILDGKKKFEVRLADFDIHEGDVLVLEEYNPETKEYTRRSIKKKVNFVTKFNPAEIHEIDEIKEHGFWLIGLGDDNLNAKQMQEKVDKTIKQYGGYWEPLSMMARITEEIGELARAINIKYGGKKSKFEGDGREIEEELADVFYTTLAIANKFDIDLGKVLMEKIEKSHEKYKEVYDDGN